MYKIIAFFCVFIIGGLIGRAYDIIILKDAGIIQAKVNQVTDKEIKYHDFGDSQDKEIFPGEIYMISLENQGNIYFNEEGKRWTGEPQRPDYKKHDVVYLKEGAEIPAEEIKITENEVSFKVKDIRKWKGFKGLLGLNKSNLVVKPREDIFLIRYKTGLIDIVSPFDVKVSAPETPQEPAIVTIFHELQPGETLASVAEKYEVTVEDIADWNDLRKSKGKYIAAPGTQLLIYTNKNSGK